MDLTKIFRVKPNQYVKIKDFNEIDKSIWEKPILETFEKAADLFIKYENNEIKIFAASEWWVLEEWGRDTFISLPGLLLVRKKFEEAKKIILKYANLIKNGLVPCKIKENEIYYNSADTSLWFIYAIKKYVEYTKDWKFVEEIADKIENILMFYIVGTGYYEQEKFQKIYMDKDYLIVSPARATWMDANAFGKLPPVTPRNGKAVEINALFYLALKFAIEIENNTNYEMKLKVDKISKKLKKSFREKFWDKERKILFDVIEGDPDGNAIRPNMLFAALANDLLTFEQKKRVFEVVKNELLTPAGIRTLSPKHPKYKGVYDTFAPLEIKDQAYHQGSAWPWLFGPFIDLLVQIRRKERKNEEEIKEEIKYYLAPLVCFCLESPYKSLPELFSGDYPYEPGGTPSQAWSVAEIYRVLKEYVFK